MFKYFHECSSFNAEVNDKKSECLHKANSFIVFISLPLLLTFLIFHFGNIDKNLTTKKEIVEIIKPLKIILPEEPLTINLLSDNIEQITSTCYSLKGGLGIMSEKSKEKKPPKPPPPPPKRIIREDVQILDKRIKKTSK